jgi:cellulose biosynthesis protein BcsQ
VSFLNNLRRALNDRDQTYSKIDTAYAEIEQVQLIKLNITNAQDFLDLIASYDFKLHKITNEDFGQALHMKEQANKAILKKKQAFQDLYDAIILDPAVAMLSPNESIRELAIKFYTGADQ